MSEHESRVIIDLSDKLAKAEGELSECYAYVLKKTGAVQAVPVPELLKSAWEVAEYQEVELRRAKEVLRHARQEITRLADGGGFSCSVLDEIDSVLDEI